ncbi:hypothetical protein N9112_00520 [bacterium]|nr:hypothetical protein [bacterium]
MKYLTVNEIQMAYDLLVVSNPHITNDAQNFAELLVDVYEKTDVKVGFNELRVAMRGL